MENEITERFYMIDTNTDATLKGLKNIIAEGCCGLKTVDINYYHLAHVKMLTLSEYYYISTCCPVDHIISNVFFLHVVVKSLK